MSKRKRGRRSRSQQILWVLSLLIVGSMVVSLVIVALQPPTPVPTAFPTFTAPLPSVTPLPTFAPFATATAELLPTQPLPVQPTTEETEPVIGPAPATATPAIEPTLGITPTIEVTPPLTSTPSGADNSSQFSVAEISTGIRAVEECTPGSTVAGSEQPLIQAADPIHPDPERRWRSSQAMGVRSLPL